MAKVRCPYCGATCFEFEKTHPMDPKVTCHACKGSVSIMRFKQLLRDMINDAVIAPSRSDRV